jgi:YHS domain-containing protein
MNTDHTHTTAATGSTCSGHHAAPADAASDDVSICLVMAGTPVVTSIAAAQGLYRDYEGQRYYLCCGACGPLFDADPENYATAV